MKNQKQGDKAKRAAMAPEERQQAREKLAQEKAISKEARSVVGKASPVAVMLVDMLRKNPVDKRLQEFEAAMKVVMSEASKRPVQPSPWPIVWCPDQIIADTKAAVEAKR